ncbi:MAG: hypothetical protein ACK5LT_01775 [Lachnospirales bacterium]
MKAKINGNLVLAFLCSMKFASKKIKVYNTEVKKILEVNYFEVEA